MKLAVVTATLDPDRALDCLTSWRDNSVGPVAYYGVVQTDTPEAWRPTVVTKFGSFTGMSTQEILGVVPAFALGVQKALEDGADLIACLHDDLLIEQDGWDEPVRDHFTQHPRCGLVGFGGGKGLGSSDLYQTPYHPMQLARQDFISNMRDAEAHGRRVTTAERVSCLDGFSQIGRRQFWEGRINAYSNVRPTVDYKAEQLFQIMTNWGVRHHFYDGMLGCFAARLGWETWMLPVKCHHYGGRTAVADTRYHDWANQQRPDLLETATGDQMFWQQAHRIGYDQFRDILPLRTP